MTGIGASPWRPYMAISRSEASVFVGSPVDGPPRWISITIRGSSRLIANPIASPLSAIPGPLVVVTASDPPNAAPTDEATAAISSSAWNVATPKFLCFASSWRMSDAGVMGTNLRTQVVQKAFLQRQAPKIKQYYH